VIRGLRLLYVLPNVPSRVRVRPFNLIRELSTRHEITALCLVPSPDEERHLAELARYCRVEPVPLVRAQARRRCARAGVSATPLWVSYFASDDMRSRLRDRLSSGACDIVHLEHIKTAPWIAGLPRSGIPVVYDAVDCATLYLTRRYRSIPLTRPLQKALWGSELVKMRRYERDAVRSYDTTLVNSPVDREALARLCGPDTQIRALLNGTDLTYFCRWDGPRQWGQLVFCGKLDYFPNAQAAHFLARDVMPRVWLDEPSAQLTIVGSNPGPSIRRLANDPRITVTGYVDDVRPYVGNASIALCPVLVKAGIQNKILEAMALGTPVVATTLAAEGLDVRHQTHLLTGTGPHELATAVLRLLRDPALRETLADSAHEFVQRHHDWSAVAHELEAAYEQVYRGTALAQDKHRRLAV